MVSSAFIREHHDQSEPSGRVGVRRHRGLGQREPAGGSGAALRAAGGARARGRAAGRRRPARRQPPSAHAAVYARVRYLHIILPYNTCPFISLAWYRVHIVFPSSLAKYKKFPKKNKIMLSNCLYSDTLIAKLTTVNYYYY